MLKKFSFHYKHFFTIFIVFHCIISILATRTALAEIKVIWAVDDGEKIKQDDINNPLKNGNSVWDGNQIRIFGAANEIVAFQIMVEADASGASNVNVTISDLKSGANTIRNDFTLPGADESDLNNSVGRRIELFKEHYLHVTEPSRTLYFSQTERLNGVGWWPDALIPFEVGKSRGGTPFDIGANLNQGVWVDIYIPKDTPAGVYTGTATVTENNGANPRSIPLTLTVYDFSLPDENHLRTLAGIGDRCRIAERHGIVCKEDLERYFQVEKQYAKMAHRHRLDVVTDRYIDDAGQPYFPDEVYLSGELYNSAHGYEGPCENFGNQLFIPGINAGDAATVEAWYNWFQYHGFPWDKAFWYIFDEPLPDNYPWIREQADWMHSLTHPLKVFLTEYINDDLIKGSSPEYIDIWCPPASEGSGGYNIADAAERQSAGFEVGTYNGHRPGAGTVLIDDDAISMRTWGWIAFKHNVDLWFYWDVMHWMDMGQQTDVWNDPLTFDNTVEDWENLGNGDGTLFYPGEDKIYPSGDRGIKGPISSIRMKNWRRGMQDYEYLYLATQEGHSAEVDDIIAEVIPRVLSDATGLSAKGWSSCGACWEMARRSIANAILGVPIPPNPPVIENVVATNLTHLSATIVWTTNKPATSKVEYGATTGYGSVIYDSNLVMCHQVKLSGLTPMTTYHYRVTSQDASGQSSTSADYTFYAFTAGAKILRVKQDYPTIIQAMKPARYGDIIQVEAGRYSPDTWETFPIRLKNGVILLGAGRDVTTLDAGATEYTWVVDCEGTSDAMISGFTITGGNDVWVAGISAFQASNLFITNNKISHNLGTGVIIHDSNNVAVSDNIISDNRAAGIWFFTNTSGTISNNVIYNNHDEVGGAAGGIQLQQDIGPTAIVRNNVLFNNYGAGVIACSKNASPIIVNNTVLGTDTIINKGAIHCDLNSNPTILNNIVANNINGYGIAAGDTSQPQLSYNCTWNNKLDYYYVGFPGEGFIWKKDPLFVDEANHDYHLQPGSPCINAGNPDPQYNDPDGSRNNMGAYGGPYAKIEPPPIKYGDVSGDGRVTAYDASLVLQHIVGLIELSPEQQKAADVTGNGAISALDAAMILQYTVGLITQFPIQRGAPILTAKDENQILIKIIAELENIPLTAEQKQVLEQLKHIIWQQSLPSHTALLQNYPNPFNPETWLPYKLAKDAFVTICIYNIKGQLIRTLHLGNQKAGSYVVKNKAAYWDGRDSLGQNVASGVYFYKLQAGNFSATRKMVILK